MKTPLRILIVGGYGTFGGRLVELLEDEPRLVLLVGGRSLQKAREYCAKRPASKAKLVPVAFDRENADSQQLTTLDVALVVDASGPFQHYGAQAYRLIQHCIDYRVHYLDLADGSQFVAGISQFDEAARRAGVFVLSGVSSFPVLTAAVARRLQEGLRQITAIYAGIAPSPFAGVGLNVIRAIASYSGQRVPVRRNGAAAVGWPITESMEVVIGVPGHVPLESRRFSLVDVPDLRTLPQLFPAVHDVWVGAAPVPASLHRALWGFAWLVRLRLLPTISWLSRLMTFVMARVRWGEHCGGMFVRIEGESLEGVPATREWHMLAEGNDGPLIPCMGVEALVRKLLEGTVPEPGARTATSDVSLADYEKLFSRRLIYSGSREFGANIASQPLYQRTLGNAWDRLSPQIRQLHSVSDESSFVGECTVDRGRNPFAWLIATLIGFPRAGTTQEISVQLVKQGNAERWIREVGGRRFSSVQSPGRGRHQWLIRERFGPVAVYMALVVEGECLRYVILSWTFFGIPLPLALGPRSAALESVQQGKFRFDVELRHPFTGLIVRYQGTLSPNLNPEAGYPTPHGKHDADVIANPHPAGRPPKFHS